MKILSILSFNESKDRIKRQTFGFNKFYNLLNSLPKAKYIWLLIDH